MSYASGFMVGASIGKAIHNLMCPDGAASSGRTAPPQETAPFFGTPADIPVFSRAAASPGRRRYRAAAIVQNRALADMLCRGLCRLAGIDAVEANILTGSLLIRSSDEALLDRVEHFLGTRLFRPVSGCVPPGGGMSQPQLSAYAETLLDTLDLFSRFISRNTANVLDLRSLVSLLFIVRGMRKMIALNQRPSGPQMLWWAASLMRGRR